MSLLLNGMIWLPTLMSVNIMCKFKIKFANFKPFGLDCLKGFLWRKEKELGLKRLDELESLEINSQTFFIELTFRRRYLLIQTVKKEYSIIIIFNDI